MLSLDNILQRANQPLHNVVAVYCYGSRVYGTFHKKSDYDFIIVVKKRDNEQFSDTLININYFDTVAHQHRLNEHEISALECHFLSPEFILLQKHSFNFKLDLSKLRHSLAAKSSNSWVKAKKKLTIPESYDLDLGRKSLFHSFRIIEYGIQIAEHGRIVDYSSCNQLYSEIMNYYDWNTMFDEFKDRYNELCSKFRTVAPK